MKTVSLIIPFHNRASFLPRTLQSVLCQTYRPLELLLVDNASTDGSRSLAEAFAQKYSVEDFTVRLLSEPERGAARARNAGLRVAAGDFCYFFDSDDVLSRDYLTRAVEDMERTESDVVGCYTTMVWPDGRRKERRYVKLPTATDQILSAQLSTQSIFWRTEYLRCLGGWNEHLPLWNDWELGVRLLLSRPKMSWLGDKAFHLVLQHDESLTGKNLASSADKIVLALRAVKDLVKEQNENRWALLSALKMRCAIVAGQIGRQGSPVGAERVLDVMRDEPLPQKNIFAASALYHYARCGGHGAWRIARVLGKRA